MIAQQSRTWYGSNPRVELVSYTVCAYCCNTGPEALNEEDARALAIGQGWYGRDAVIGEEIVTVFTCPDCLKTA